MKDLNSQRAGKRVLVTGASRGIGAATARYLASCGMQVALGYGRSQDRAQEVMESMEGSGHMTLPLNINDEESVKQGFDKILKAFEGLDGLVNNAGITSDQLLLRMKPRTFDEVIQTNLRGAFLCTRLALKAMVKARRGSVVNITSVVGQVGGIGQANYAASKAGLEAFSKSVAKELGSRHIRVNCVAPGYILTDMTGEISEELKKHYVSLIPLQSMGEPLDVAQAVGFLLSDESKYITGQTLSVNGGMVM